MVEVAATLRAMPLVPEAALGLGAAARALAERLLRMPSAQLERLRCVGGPELLLVLGAEEDLPWCDGIRYFARDPEANGIYLACAEGVSVGPQLLALALARRHAKAGLEPPFLVSLDPPLVVPLKTARTATARLVQEYVTRHAQVGP